MSSLARCRKARQPFSSSRLAPLPCGPLLCREAVAIRPPPRRSPGRRRHAPRRPGRPSLLAGGVEAAPFALGVAEHVRVQATGGHQLLVGAALLDLAVVEHDDLLGQRDRARAVGDDEGGAAAHHFLQRGPDAELRLHVHAAGGVVEDEDARVHDERPRDRDTLALAAAEREAALADDRLVALGERLDEVVGLRGLRRRPDLLVARLGPAEADVLGDRRAEEERVLVHDADVPAQVGQLQVAHVLAVDEHGAAARVVEPRHEIGQGRLAAASVADERDGVAGRDLEAHASQHRPVDVAEPDVVEGDGTGGAGGLDGAGGDELRRRQPERVPQRLRVRLLRHLERRVQHFVDALAAGDRPLRQPGEPADDLRRVHEHHQVDVERDQRAEAEAPVDHLASAVIQQEGDCDIRDERDQRDVDGARARRCDARLEHLVAAVAELVELVVFAREDADDAAAHDVLLGGSRHVGDLLLHVQQDRLQAEAEPDGHQQQERHERQRHERELPVHEEEDDGDGDHHHDVGGEEDEAVAEEHAHVLDIAHGPAHELSRRPAVEVAERLAQHVRPHAVPQVVLDVEADLAGREAPADADGEAHDGDAEEREAVGDQQAGLAVDESIVDRELDDPRDDEAEAHLGEGQGKAEDGQPFVVTEESEDAPERLHLLLSLP